MRIALALSALCIAAALPSLVRADDTPPNPAPSAPPPGADSTPPLADLKPTIGPADVKLGHELTLRLPDGFLFFDAGQARQLATAMGNVPDDALVGIVAAQPIEGQRAADWFVEVTYYDQGYVRDDEKLDADAILKSITEGTEAANAERVKAGFKPMKVDGWAEPPRYDKALHHLVWAVKGSDADGSVINFNTRVLGRRGVASLNLVASPEELPVAKPSVAALLAATAFDTGARYEDFEQGKDKVAEYGLAALVAGGAGAVALKVAKVGLIAKFWKLIVLAFVALGGFVRRMLGLKQKSKEPAPPTPPSGDSPPNA